MLSNNCTERPSDLIFSRAMGVATADRESATYAVAATRPEGHSSNHSLQFSRIDTDASALPSPPVRSNENGDERVGRMKHRRVQRR